MEVRLFLNPGSRETEGITDEKFPEGSVKNASNYCRTPHDMFYSEEPWCFTGADGAAATCGIPICPGDVGVLV